MRQNKTPDEKSLYVAPGFLPVTQRQLNLYYYFLFIKNILARQPVRDVLELGCGRGTTALYLATYLGFNLSLLDNSADAIELARQSFAEHQANANFYIAEAPATHLPGESFDAIVSIGLAEHFASVDALFREQYRLLKPGGVMISLNIPKKFSVQAVNILWRFMQKYVARSYSEKLSADYYRNSLTATEYAVAAERAGFKKINITHVAPFPLITPASLAVDKKITILYKWLLWFRSQYSHYPYQTNPVLAQAHFLIGRKI